jgi:hypothetical protein
VFVDADDIVDCAKDIVYDHLSHMAFDMCSNLCTSELFHLLHKAQYWDLHPHDLFNDCLVHAAGCGNIAVIRRLCRWGACAYSAAIREATWAGNIRVVRYLARRSGMSRARLAEAMGVSANDYRKVLGLVERL